MANVAVLLSVKAGGTSPYDATCEEHRSLLRSSRAMNWMHFGAEIVSGPGSVEESARLTGGSRVHSK
jgi:hypothetical protein